MPTRNLVVIDRLLAHVIRERNGQLATRITVAKQNTGHSSSTFQTGIPGFHNRWGVLGHPGYAQRFAVDEDHYHRRAGGIDNLQQLLLSTAQVEVGPVAHLAIEGEGVAHHHNRHIGSAGEFGGLGNAGRIRVEYVTALGVIYLTGRADTLPDALQNGDRVGMGGGTRTVILPVHDTFHRLQKGPVTQLGHHVICIRANNGHTH